MRVDSNLEQKIVLFNGLIAFAGAGFERPTIKNMYPAARVPDGTTTLKFLREQGDRRSSTPSMSARYSCVSSMTLLSMQSAVRNSHRHRRAEPA